jgi:hypothetical protein
MNSENQTSTKWLIGGVLVFLGVVSMPVLLVIFISVALLGVIGGGVSAAGGATAALNAMYGSSKAISSYVQEETYFASNTCNLSLFPAHAGKSPTNVPTWALLLGQMMEETGSTYLHGPTNTKDTSSAGAVGPFQFMKPTWQEYLPDVQRYFDSLHFYNPGQSIPQHYTRTSFREEMVAAGEMECSDGYGFPGSGGVWPWNEPIPSGASMHAIYESYSGDPPENCFLGDVKETYGSCAIANGEILATTLHIPWAVPDGNGTLALILENNVGTPPVEGNSTVTMQVFMDQLAIATGNSSSSSPYYNDYASQAVLWGACLSQAGQPFAPGAASAPSGMVWDYQNPTPPTLADEATGEVVFIGTITNGTVTVDRVGMIVGHAPAAPPFVTTGPGDVASEPQYLWMIDGPGQHRGEGYEPLPSTLPLASPGSQAIIGICTPPGT